MKPNDNALTTILVGDDRREVSITDQNDPFSIINLVDEDTKDAIASLDPELLEKDEIELKETYKPNLGAQRFRIAFWEEYDRSVKDGDGINIKKALAGTMTRAVFKKKVLKNHGVLAFVLTPPQDYSVAMKEALDMGMNTLRRILGANVVDDNGNLNHKAAEVVLKAYALVDLRVKGAVIQKIQQQSLNMNVNKTQVSVTSESTEMPLTLEEIEKELLELKGKGSEEVKPPVITQKSEGEIVDADYTKKIIEESDVKW